MRFKNLEVPSETEGINYATEVVLDAGGMDVIYEFDGSVEMSMSWGNVDKADLAYATLQGHHIEDFDPNSEFVKMLLLETPEDGGLDNEELLGWAKEILYVIQVRKGNVATD